MWLNMSRIFQRVHLSCDPNLGPFYVWVLIYKGDQGITQGGQCHWKKRSSFLRVLLEIWGMPCHTGPHQEAPEQEAEGPQTVLRIPGRAEFSSVQFGRSVVSSSLRPHESQHTRPPCPSPTPGVDSNPCPSSQWCHPAISSSVVPFSSCPQSLPASGSFPMSQLFTWGGQSTGVSASASVLLMNTQDWSSLGWTGWISLQSKGLSRVFPSSTVQKHQFFGTQLSSQSNSHIHTWPLEKP